MALSDMLSPKLVELGAVRIGTLGDQKTSRAGGTYRVPKKLDHFIVTSSFRGTDGMLSTDESLLLRLNEEHADPDGKLRQIPIVLLSDKIEDSLRSRWVHYRGKQCFASSDGKTLWKFFDLKTGDKLPEPVELAWDEDYLTKTHNGAPLFKKHTVLEFVISVREARWGGVYRFRTTSVITGDQLYGSLLHLKRLTSGVLAGMPLMLVMRPMVVAPEGKPTTVYVVHVELRGENLTDLQQKALEVARFHKANRLEMQQLNRELLLLNHEPGFAEDEAVQSDVQQEFHPEPTDPSAAFIDAFVTRVAATTKIEELNDVAATLKTVKPPLPAEQLSECELYVGRHRLSLTMADAESPTKHEPDEAKARIATPKEPEPKSSGEATTMFNAYKQRIENAAPSVSWANAIGLEVADKTANGHLTDVESEKLNELVDAKMKTIA